MAEIATPMLLRGAAKGIGYSKKKLQERIRNSAISGALRATETEFHRTFQTELQRVAKAQDSAELEAISLIWDNIAEDIGQEHLATSDTETAIEKLVEAIENTVDSELQETDKAELKEIINKSYQSSIENSDQS